MQLKMIRNRSWPGPQDGPQTVLWEIRDVPGLMVLNCQRHSFMGYQDGSFQQCGWMVAARGNLGEDDIAKQIASKLSQMVFVRRSEAVEAVRLCLEEQAS